MVKRDAGGVGGVGCSLQLLQGGRNVGGRVATGGKVLAHQIGLNGAVVVALVLLTQVTVDQAVWHFLAYEHVDNSVFRYPFRADWAIMLYLLSILFQRERTSRLRYLPLWCWSWS